MQTHIGRLAAYAALIIGSGLLAACRDAAAPVPASAPEEIGASAADTNTANATFTAQNLGVIPGGVESFGLGINAGGDVAGYSGAGTALRPVLWIGTAPMDLGVPFGPAAAAYDVNDARTVVGYSGDTLDTRGFVWKAGTFTLITAPGSGSRQQVFAYDVNNADVVAGAFLAARNTMHAFRYTSGGGLVDIHPGGVYLGSQAFAVNDQGVIAGEVMLATGETHAARWSATNAFTDLGTLGGTVGVAHGLNNAGAIVGESEEPGSGVVPFIWRSGTGMRGIGAPGSAQDISDLGRAVGFDAARFRAATKKGTATPQLLPLLPTGFASQAFAVNRCGTIAGSATISGGFNRAVRWVIAVCD
jgi:probable HAF family extracellular repeat protein